MASSDASTARASEVPAGPPETTATFRPSHFFVLASLIAATAAVIMSRQSTPERLVFISLTIAAAGLAAAGLYRTMSPFVGAGSTVAGEALSERGRAVLSREKTLVLRALKDLEFDRSMGKVSQADFEEMASRLRSRAMSLMKQLDEDASGYKTIIERELGARLAGRTAAHPVDQPPEAEPPPASVVAGLCTCGTSNDSDAIFCKRCGARLTGPMTPERPTAMPHDEHDDSMNTKKTSRNPW